MVKIAPGLGVSPLFVRTKHRCRQALFSPLCSLSLVNYLTLEKGVILEGNKETGGEKIAILARGCDSRTLIQLITERGISREHLIILGVPCRGAIPLKKIETKFPDARNCAEVTEGEGIYIIRIDNESHEMPKEELLANHCKHCAFPNPLIYDVLLEDPVEPKGQLIRTSKGWKRWHSIRGTSTGGINLPGVCAVTLAGMLVHFVIVMIVFSRDFLPPGLTDR